MNGNSLMAILILLGASNLILLVILLITRNKDPFTEIKEKLATVDGGQQRIETALKQEISRNREEMNLVAKESRQELAAAIRVLGDSNATRITEIGEAQKNQLDSFARQLGGLTEATERRLETMRATIESWIRCGPLSMRNFRAHLKRDWGTPLTS